MRKLKNLYEPMKKYWFKVFASGLAVMVVALFVVALNGRALTRAEDQRLEELIAMGYPPEVAADQVKEEFHNIDGLNGTGGIDGKFLKDVNKVSTTPSTPDTPKHTKHEWVVTEEKDSTCISEGYITYTCTGCSKTKTDKTPKVDHDYEVIEQTEATCVNPASFVYECTVCGDTYNTEYGELKPHNFIPSNDCYDATCTEEGYYHAVCSYCGALLIETSETLGHDYSDSYTVDKKATCTEEGVKSVHCERCGEIKEGSELTIPATGHTEETKVVPATFFENGTETVVCKNCGEVLSEVTIPSRAEELGGLPLLIGIGVGCLLVITLAVVGMVILIKKKRNA